MADGIKCGHRMELSMSSEQSAFSLLLTRFLSKTSNRSLQWRIYIVKFWTPPPELSVRILSISFSFWNDLAKSYVGVRPPLKDCPPPWGNPGSATAQASKNQRFEVPIKGLNIRSVHTISS